jgi:hypothetical protein
MAPRYYTTAGPTAQSTARRRELELRKILQVGDLFRWWLEPDPLMEAPD